jgi:hypothetical protein
MEWERIMRRQLCIDCFRDGREIVGLSRDHPLHEEKRTPAKGHTLKPESMAVKDKAKEITKLWSAECKPEAEAKLTSLASQNEAYLDTMFRDVLREKAVKESEEGEVIEMGYFDALIEASKGLSERPSRQ